MYILRNDIIEIVSAGVTSTLIFNDVRYIRQSEENVIFEEPFRRKD